MRYWDKQAKWEGNSAERLILARALAKERKFGIYTLAHKVGLAPDPTSHERDSGEDD